MYPGDSWSATPSRIHSFFPSLPPRVNSALIHTSARESIGCREAFEAAVRAAVEFRLQTGHRMRACQAVLEAFNDDETGAGDDATATT